MEKLRPGQMRCPRTPTPLKPGRCVGGVLGREFVVRGLRLGGCGFSAVARLTWLFFLWEGVVGFCGGSMLLGLVPWRSRTVKESLRPVEHRSVAVGVPPPRRRAELRIGSHAAHYSVLALIDGMMQETH